MCRYQLLRLRFYQEPGSWGYGWCWLEVEVVCIQPIVREFAFLIYHSQYHLSILRVDFRALRVTYLLSIFGHGIAKCPHPALEVKMNFLPLVYDICTGVII